MNDIKIVQMEDQRKKHIAVLCLPELEGFLGDIVEHLKKEYIVTTCYSKDMAELERAIAGADVIFLDWLNELAVELTKSNLLDGKKVIVRGHSYEMLSGFLPHINFSKISVLIFVAEHMKAIAIQQLPGLLNPAMNPPAIFVVPNGVAC